MAKDNFNYIAFKILTYYYGCLKNKIVFDEKVFLATVNDNNIDDTYFIEVLRSLVNEGYLEGLVFTNAWGNVYILANDYVDGSITHKGVEYLTENSAMKKAHGFAKEAGGLIVKLIPFVM